MFAVPSVHPLHETTTSSSPGAKPMSSASRQRRIVVASLRAGIITDPIGKVDIYSPFTPIGQFRGRKGNSHSGKRIQIED
jgi:hypothetical protein